jgi:hypothetical protein
LKERRKKYEQFRSSSTNENLSETSRTSQSIRFITSKTSSKNRELFKELIKVSFKLSQNLSSKVQSSQIFLRKNKEKQSITQFENIKSSSAESFRELSKSSTESSQNFSESSQNFSESSQNFSEFFQNFAESFKNISLSERTRDEISKIILQKPKNRHSETFTNHKESSHSIIFSSFSEVEMTSQHSEQVDQNMQEMIQTVIRRMMSKIIQQSVTAIVNVISTTATTRSNSLSASNHSQMTSRAISESRSDR